MGYMLSNSPYLVNLFIIIILPQEHAIRNSEDNLLKLTLILTHLGYQQESIQRSVNALENVKEQVNLYNTVYIYFCTLYVLKSGRHSVTDVGTEAAKDTRILWI